MGGGGAGPASPARLPNAWHPHRAPVLPGPAAPPAAPTGTGGRGVQRPCLESASLLPSAEIDPIFFLLFSNLTRPCRPGRPIPPAARDAERRSGARGPVYLAGVCRLRYARAPSGGGPGEARRRERSWAAPSPAAGPAAANPGRGGRVGGTPLLCSRRRGSEGSPPRPSWLSPAKSEAPDRRREEDPRRRAQRGRRLPQPRGTSPAGGGGMLLGGCAPPACLRCGGQSSPPCQRDGAFSSGSVAGIVGWCRSPTRPWPLPAEAGQDLPSLSLFSLLPPQCSFLPLVTSPALCPLQTQSSRDGVLFS